MVASLRHGIGPVAMSNDLRSEDDSSHYSPATHCDEIGGQSPRAFRRHIQQRRCHSHCSDNVGVFRSNFVDSRAARDKTARCRFAPGSEKMASTDDVRDCL